MTRLKLAAVRTSRRALQLSIALGAVALRVFLASVSALNVADVAYASTRCNELSTTDACHNYARCKATYRCARGDEDYYVREARHESFTREFAGGNRSAIPLINDFEDWKSGTFGWQMQATSPRTSRTALGWDTFDFTVIGSLELAEGYLVFDTDKGMVWGDVSFQGVVTQTTSGHTHVAVFNFMTVFLGSNVRVRFIGSNAVSIMSRSSMIIDTSLQVRSGTLGGFPGGGFIGTATRNNNQNGPGSSSLRVYVKTLSTYGSHIPEIQEIETSAAQGQKIEGYFLVTYGNDGRVSQRIPYDASAYEVQKYLETAFPDIGELHVERDDTKQQVPEISRLWRITFLTVVGNVPQLHVRSFLTGLDSTVVSRTVRDGNQLSGSYRLSFLGKTTTEIPYDITAEGLRDRLLREFSFLADARVSRSDATSQCLQGSTLPDQSASGSITNTASGERYQASEWFVPNARLVDEPLDRVKNYRDKLCASGRGAANGFVWKLQLWTTEGNSIATSPSAPVYTQSDPAAALVVDAAKLEGVGAAAEVVDSQCFSLAFGGAGASFTSEGGRGYTDWHRKLPAFAQIYSSSEVYDLLGGSGGAGGGREPVDVFPVVQPTLGGAGGGAIHLRAVNDILIGVTGKVTVNGGAGGEGYTAGGGGSGGTILIESGGTVSHHGAIEAVGGHGGASSGSAPGGGGSGGRIAVYAQAFSTWKSGVIVASGGSSQDARAVGGRGSTRIQVLTSLGYRVDPSVGAAGTAKSLLLTGAEDYAAGSEGIVSGAAHQVVRNGPKYVLSGASQPERVSFFVMYDRLAEGKSTANRGVVFGIHGVASQPQSAANKDEFLIAVGMINGAFTHEANCFHLPRQVFQEKIQRNRWYKVDVLVDWATRTYRIQLNDVLRVDSAAFTGDAIAALSLNNHHALSSWWDEVYVGPDFLRQFKCPTFRPTVDTADAHGDGNGVLVVSKRELRKLWRNSVRGPATAMHAKVKHDSHISKREVYRHDNGGLVPLDGEPHRAFFNDVKENESEEADGTSEAELSDTDEEIVSLAETLTLRNLAQDSSIVQPLETGLDFDALAAADTSGAVQGHGPTIYWYSEVYNASSGWGAVGACSTQNWLDWRNEGIMFQFTNVSDPLGDRTLSLLADRPKVLFNKRSKRFVMWMHVDNSSNLMGLTGVASSEYPNGPFAFTKSFYADAPLESPGGQSINETHDQTVAVVEASDGAVEDRAFLIRTVFKTVEYWLPRAVMDPLWEGVKDESGQPDFGLSYHRAFYHEGYDNPNDIYLQRWRMEDLPWQVTCCEPTNAANCTAVYDVPSDPLKLCPDGMEKTDIIGQSQMKAGSHVRTRYKDPLDDANSFFVPHSVPSHTPWGFQVYNIKTWRGNYFDALSTNITEFIFHRFAGERRRVEMEKDASVQYTYPNEEEAIEIIPINDTEIVDLLLGQLGVPISAAFRNKYSSYDLAEIDLNHDGKITAYEVSTMKAAQAMETRLSEQLIASLTGDFEALKEAQLSVLDADGDGEITLPEFTNWVGLDPNLLFDQFDLDKSGYLDENELARLLWYRQLPRLDTAMILLDPSFDGRVHYPRFRDQLKDAPEYMFTAYDFDSSETLTQDEIDLMVKDLRLFAKRPVIEALKNATTGSIKKADYIAWLSATTSLLGDVRNSLKVDNAVHPTRPDSLTGPLHVVERRRAKYVAISQLSDDFMATKGLLKEVEGDFEGREALLNYFEFAADLFGLRDEDLHVSIPESERAGIQPYRLFLSPRELGDRASYWNGRHWEGRPSAPSLFTYGQQCEQYAGVSDGGCLPCLTRSPFVTATYEQYQSQARSTAHCRSYKELDAYVKEFDQQVSIQLQYQQQSVYGPQGLQPHMSPCFNQTQFFPCDVHKIVDGNVADSLRNMSARATAWQLAWENHPNNAGSSEKIRADEHQRISRGPSFIERFPQRVREPLQSEQIDVTAMLAPDQFADILGGGS